MFFTFLCALVCFFSVCVTHFRPTYFYPEEPSFKGLQQPQNALGAKRRWWNHKVLHSEKQPAPRGPVPVRTRPPNHRGNTTIQFLLAAPPQSGSRCWSRSQQLGGPEGGIDPTQPPQTTAGRSRRRHWSRFRARGEHENLPDLQNSLLTSQRPIPPNP